jgi:hypothetical protein
MDVADRCVDLFALRTAVATLYWARHHCPDVAAPGAVARIDDAVGHLKAGRGHFGGELRVACNALLSLDPDPGGRRRTTAIDRLAALTHVDDTSAIVLTAMADAPTPRPSAPPTLFDSQPTGSDDA